MNTLRPRIHWMVWAFVLVVAMIVLGAELFLMKNSQHRVAKALPVLAKVPDFSFASETGAPVTKASLAGKIWIADFIFTRCAGPCPLMSERMRQFQAASENIAGGGVRLISVTVDPAYDTPPVLAKYAAKYGANPDRWSFLTGEPVTVENFITKGVLLGLSRDGEGIPVHSQKFVVVDREGNIRAYHDLDDAASLLPKLLDDVDALSREKQTPMPAPPSASKSAPEIPKK